MVSERSEYDGERCGAYLARMRTFSVEQSILNQQSPLLPVPGSCFLGLKPDMAVLPVIFQMNGLFEGPSARLKAGERHAPS